MSALLAQAQQMQRQLMEAQEKLANAEVQGEAGGGLVQVTVRGSGEGGGDPDRPEGRRSRGTSTPLQDLILGALSDASKQVTIMMQSHLGPLAGGLGGNWAPGSRGAAVFEGPVQDLIDELGKLPGIGPKSSSASPSTCSQVEPPDIDRLTAVLARVRDGVQFCEVCGNVSDTERCRICATPAATVRRCVSWRNRRDVRAVEAHPRVPRRHHVLGGALDPLSGIGPSAAQSVSC